MKLLNVFRLVIFQMQGLDYCKISEYPIYQMIKTQVLSLSMKKIN